MFLQCNDSYKCNGSRSSEKSSRTISKPEEVRTYTIKDQSKLKISPFDVILFGLFLQIVDFKQNMYLVINGNYNLFGSYEIPSNLTSSRISYNFPKKNQFSKKINIIYIDNDIVPRFTYFK